MEPFDTQQIMCCSNRRTIIFGGGHVRSNVMSSEVSRGSNTDNIVNTISRDKIIKNCGTYHASDYVK